jgi:carboxylesterase type B
MADRTAKVEVDTTNGPVRGAHENGLTVFKGVPYAAPPVGDLRWRPAQPHAGWSSPRDATEFGPSAPQPYFEGGDPVLGGHGFPPFDEDCLTLNVWTPAADDGARPVLIWIHGGGFISGSGSLPIYSGETFARDGDLVVVTINYRLGPLGYLSFGSFESGNFWLTDQIAALQWVRDNIAAFGGNPADITVAGQSGGAFSTAALAGHPESRGLFRRAILQSPPLGLRVPTPEESSQITATFMEIVGAKDLDALREVPWSRLLEATFEMFGRSMRWGHWPVPFLPVVDGAGLAKPPGEILLEDAALAIDLMVGSTKEEANFSFALNPAYAEATAEQVVARAAEAFGDEAADVYAEYQAKRPGATPLDVLMDLNSDELFTAPLLELAGRRAARGRPVWAYRFDFPSPAYDGRLAAAHCLELPFAFDNFDDWAHAPLASGIDSPAREGLAASMHQAWISFIRTGDPNHPGLPKWDRYEQGTHTTMLFDTVSTTSPTDARRPSSESA